MANTQTQQNYKKEYITWTCPKCKKSFALEIHSPRLHFCKTNIGTKYNPIPCRTMFPSQKERDVIYQLQKGVIIPE